LNVIPARCVKLYMESEGKSLGGDSACMRYVSLFGEVVHLKDAWSASGSTSSWPVVLVQMTVSRFRLMRVLFAAMIVAATVGGCGDTKSQAAMAVLGRGRTAAGASFVATLQPTSKCPLQVRIVEAGIANMVCYSIFEQPVRPKIGCLPGGRLVLHWRVEPTARGVQLTLSNGRRITSSVIKIASGLGGPAGVYYQAVRGPTPIPVAVREIGGASRAEGVRRVFECASPFVKHVGRDERPFAEIPTPDGSLTISNRVVRILGKDHQGLTAVLEDSTHAIVGAGALRLLPPLRWEARRICSGSSPFTVLYGVIEGGYRVFVQFGHRLYALRAKPIPGWVGLRGTLVYGIWSSVPRELIVQTASGEVVERMEIGNLIAQTPCL
jgi:hypothetical protein